jgi:hypothetical protein
MLMCPVTSGAGNAPHQYIVTVILGNIHTLCSRDILCLERCLISRIDSCVGKINRDVLHGQQIVDMELQRIFPDSATSCENQRCDCRILEVHGGCVWSRDIHVTVSVIIERDVCRQGYVNPFAGCNGSSGRFGVVCVYVAVFIV